MTMNYLTSPYIISQRCLHLKPEVTDQWCIIKVIFIIQSKLKQASFQLFVRPGDWMEEKFYYL